MHPSPFPLFLLLPLFALPGCVASVDTAARARAARDLSCPESQLVVAQLASPATVEVTGCGAAARYTCPVSAGPGRGLDERVCIREADPLRRFTAGPEEIREPATR